jgi:hypothetical protein
MAHTVKLDVPQLEIAHANIAFLVKKNGHAFGRLLISKGAVVWRPKFKNKRGRKLNWTNFDNVMEMHGRSIRGG